MEKQQLHSILLQGLQRLGGSVLFCGVLLMGCLVVILGFVVLVLSLIFGLNIKCLGVE